MPIVSVMKPLRMVGESAFTEPAERTLSRVPHLDKSEQTACMRKRQTVTRAYEGTETVDSHSSGTVTLRKEVTNNSASARICRATRNASYMRNEISF
jgi:hypothetical protein